MKVDSRKSFSSNSKKTSNNLGLYIRNFNIEEPIFVYLNNFSPFNLDSKQFRYLRKKTSALGHEFVSMNEVKRFFAQQFYRQLAR